MTGDPKFDNKFNTQGPVIHLQQEILKVSREGQNLLIHPDITKYMGKKMILSKKLDGLP